MHEIRNNGVEFAQCMNRVCPAHRKRYDLQILVIFLDDDTHVGNKGLIHEKGEL